MRLRIKMERRIVYGKWRHLLSLIAKDVSMENNIKWLKNKNRWRVYWHEKNIVGYPEKSVNILQ